ncbi:hypothetical protein HDU97_000644 [Phlyctochytrium planicorne]|nr:hypothetical protein HDU97_000644 [Phlyctochytrium planicorne]
MSLSLKKAFERRQDELLFAKNRANQLAKSAKSQRVQKPEWNSEITTYNPVTTRTGLRLKPQNALAGSFPELAPIPIKSLRPERRLPSHSGEASRPKNAGIKRKRPLNLNSAAPKLRQDIRTSPPTKLNDSLLFRLSKLDNIDFDLLDSLDTKPKISEGKSKAKESLPSASPSSSISNSASTSSLLPTTAFTSLSLPETLERARESVLKGKSISVKPSHSDQMKQRPPIDSETESKHEGFTHQRSRVGREESPGDNFVIKEVKDFVPTIISEITEKIANLLRNTLHAGQRTSVIPVDGEGGQRDSEWDSIGDNRVVEIQRVPNEQIAKEEYLFGTENEMDPKADDAPSEKELRLSDAACLEIVAKKEQFEKSLSSMGMDHITENLAFLAERLADDFLKELLHEGFEEADSVLETMVNNLIFEEFGVR